MDRLKKIFKYFIALLSILIVFGLVISGLILAVFFVYNKQIELFLVTIIGFGISLLFLYGVSKEAFKVFQNFDLSAFIFSFIFLVVALGITQLRLII